jgi:hypothetical protein
MSRSTLLAAALVITAVAVAIAGCSGGSKDSSMLSGADIFDPHRFSMATYDVTLTRGDNVSHQGFIVMANTSGKEGDVLTSISFHDNVSARADTLISRNGKKTLNVLISDINESSLQFSGGSPLFNMTLLDQAWNSLDENYKLWGTANVTVPAGTFADCSVYGGSKSVVFGGESSQVQVFYYMHPSSAVPVMYEVNGTAGLYVYRLKHVYELGDIAGTPERVVQSFFDDLDNGRLDEAFKCLTTYDQNSGRYKAPDDSTYREFLANMNRTYRTGDESYRVQFVNVSPSQPVTSQLGDNIRLVPWDSIHYQVGTLSVYRLSGSFYVAEIGGQWRIIV